MAVATYTHTVTQAAAPLDGAFVWVSTDAPGADVVASGHTDAFGHVTFTLDEGDYFVFCQRAGTNFPNPTTESVTAPTDSGSTDGTAASGALDALIRRTRRLAGDIDDDAPLFADEDVQDALGRTQQHARQEPLVTQFAYTPTGGGYTLFIHAGGLGDWGADALLQDLHFATVTADDADLLAGHWSFDTPRASPLLWLTGATYDVYRAAADLCEQRAATQAESYDLSTDATRLARSQMATAWHAQAGRLLRRARPVSGKIRRDDVGPDHRYNPLYGTRSR